MKPYLTFLILVVLIFGCDYPRTQLPKHFEFQYEVGDKLLYKSNLNQYDTLVVNYKNIDFSGDNPEGYSSEYFEFQDVTMYFSKDKDSIRMGNIWYHDMKIQLYVTTNNGLSGYEGPRKLLRWKKYLFFDMDTIQTEDGVIINGEKYNDVYIIDRGEEFLDSTELVRKIILNFQSGILKYHKIDSEEFEFVRKL